MEIYLQRHATVTVCTGTAAIVFSRSTKVSRQRLVPRRNTAPSRQSAASRSSVRVSHRNDRISVRRHRPTQTRLIYFHSPPFINNLFSRRRASADCPSTLGRNINTTRTVGKKKKSPATFRTAGKRRAYR